MKRYWVSFLFAAIPAIALPAHAERICLQNSGAQARYEAKAVDKKTVILRQLEGDKETAALKLTVVCSGMSAADTIRLSGEPNCAQTGDSFYDKPANDRSQVCLIESVRRQSPEK